LVDSYEIAHDFQWYVVDKLCPPLNKDRKDWRVSREKSYKILYGNLIQSDLISTEDLVNLEPVPGVYILFGKLIQ
jgi:hypothetical protein